MNKCIAFRWKQKKTHFLSVKYKDHLFLKSQQKKFHHLLIIILKKNNDSSQFLFDVVYLIQITAVNYIHV